MGVEFLRRPRECSATCRAASVGLSGEEWTKERPEQGSRCLQRSKPVAHLARLQMPPECRTSGFVCRLLCSENMVVTVGW